jgi:hypothetical protein
MSHWTLTRGSVILVLFKTTATYLYCVSPTGFPRTRDFKFNPLFPDVFLFHVAPPCVLVHTHVEEFCSFRIQRGSAAGVRALMLFQSHFYFSSNIIGMSLLLIPFIGPIGIRTSDVIAYLLYTV